MTPVTPIRSNEPPEASAIKPIRAALESANARCSVLVQALDNVALAETVDIVTVLREDVANVLCEQIGEIDKLIGEEQS